MILTVNILNCNMDFKLVRLYNNNLYTYFVLKIIFKKIKSIIKNKFRIFHTNNKY